MSEQHRRLVISERTSLSILFLFTGGFMLAEGLQNWIRGKIETHPEVIMLLLVTYAIAFSMFVLAVLKDDIVLKLRHLPVAALIFTILTSAYVIIQVEFNGAYRTDALAFTHYSAILYLNGLNPYTQDLQVALAKFHVDPEFITLSPSGDLISNLNYPALHFLLFVPAVFLGISDMRVVVFLFEIGTILSIYLWSPRELRPLILIPIFAGSDLAITFNAGSITDFLWVLPLVLMIFVRDKPIFAGIAYGVASAIKQTPWLLGPFLLVYFWREGKGHELKNRALRTIQFLAAALVAFSIPNAKFMWENFGAWYDGVVTPAFGNLVALTQGLSLLTQAGGVPLPLRFYTLSIIAVFLVLLFNYAIYFDKLRQAVWAFPAIMMWFSYRGLQNYFIYWTPLLVVASVILYRESIQH